MEEVSHWGLALSAHSIIPLPVLSLIHVVLKMRALSFLLCSPVVVSPRHDAQSGTLSQMNSSFWKLLCSQCCVTATKINCYNPYKLQLRNQDNSEPSLSGRIWAFIKKDTGLTAFAKAASRLITVTL